MRVISGIARGIKLETLSGSDITRPTIDRVKEGLFSSVQFKIPGANVLDLFAGSGQLGIEALSRGAAHCTFVDENNKAVKIIEQNLKNTNLQKSSSVVNKSAQSFLNTYFGKFDLILLDPPYSSCYIEQLLPTLCSFTLSGGVIICETALSTVLPLAVDELKLIKVYKYGSVKITKYQKI